MDNSQKALQMAFAAFLFVIAASTAIFLYTTLMTNAKQIMVISDNNNMSAEYVDYTDESSKRYISKAEIVMTILDIENNKSYITEVSVDGYTFKSDISAKEKKEQEEKLKTWCNGTSPNDKYTSAYDVDTDKNKKILTYTKSNS